MARRNSRFVNQKIIVGNKSVQGEGLTDSALDTLAGRGFPSGTKLKFQQTAAPTGWTKDTTHDDKAIRVVSGTASNGGVDSFSTTFGAGKTTESHTLSTPQIASHAHFASYRISPTGGTPDRPNSGGNTGTISYVATTSSGGSQGHSHNLDLDIAYVDVIIATKD